MDWLDVFVGKDHENSQNNSNLKPIAATADLKELFSLGPANPDAGFPERIFPSNPSTFSDSYTKYYDALSKFAQDLLEAMTGPLGVESGYFNQYLTHHASALRALNYPALPEGYECKPNEFRASAHTDYGTVTILRSGGPGLQVCYYSHGIL